jgi:hypothetical protein
MNRPRRATEIPEEPFNALVKLTVGFSIGTGAGAAVCWYYGIPMGLSVIGGILVLGIALALISDLGFFS